MADVEQGNYGTHLNVYDWKKKKLIQKIDLGLEGVMPLEIRFLHNPKATEGFVGCALFAKMFRFYKTGESRSDFVHLTNFCPRQGRLGSRESHRHSQQESGRLGAA